MRIILKPLGAVVVGSAMVILAIMAVRGRQPGESNPAVATSSVTAPPSLSAGPKMASADPGAVVYDDALKNGWGDFSWAKHDTADTKRSAPGRCIRVESKQFEAVAFNHAPLSVAPYDRITFRIHGGDKGGQRLKVVAQYGSDKDVKNGTEHLLPTLASDEWKTVTVTLESLGIAGKNNVTSFWIQEGYGVTLTPYFVDDMRFLRPNETAPDS
ncbi:MAG: hypothetical protein H8F28_05080 [Fibrella sp.]|nr:hypothetical protein [Armatimonadota bacterium]